MGGKSEIKRMAKRTVVPSSSIKNAIFRQGEKNERDEVDAALDVFDMTPEQFASFIADNELKKSPREALEEDVLHKTVLGEQASNVKAEPEQPQKNKERKSMLFQNKKLKPKTRKMLDALEASLSMEQHDMAVKALAAAEKEIDYDARLGWHARNRIENRYSVLEIYVEEAIEKLGVVINATRKMVAAKDTASPKDLDAIGNMLLSIQCGLERMKDNI